MLINDALTLRKQHFLVPDISKKLSAKYHKNISQLGLCNLFNSMREAQAIQVFIPEYEYPSRTDMENVFSELLQKERNAITQYGGVTLRRNLMIKILKHYCNQKFTYMELKNKLNENKSDNVFLQHFNYLQKYNFIEPCDGGVFKFCERVKTWYTWGKV